MKNENCGNCRFFEQIKDNRGKCMRFPPSSIKHKSGEIMALYPEVYKQDKACGERRAEVEYYSDLADTGDTNET